MNNIWNIILCLWIVAMIVVTFIFMFLTIRKGIIAGKYPVTWKELGFFVYGCFTVGVPFLYIIYRIGG